MHSHLITIIVTHLYNFILFLSFVFTNDEKDKRRNTHVTPSPSLPRDNKVMLSYTPNFLLFHTDFEKAKDFRPRLCLCFVQLPFFFVTCAMDVFCSPLLPKTFKNDRLMHLLVILFHLTGVCLQLAFS